jgi:hypothetical protein
MGLPTPADLQAELQAAGAYDSSLDLQRALDEAVEALEDAAECTPFLAPETATARRFHAPGPRGTYEGTQNGGGRVLFLGCGLVELESLTVDGTELAVDADFHLESEEEGAPFTRVRFTPPVYAAPHGIVITGRWGYCAELPPLAFAAILGHAAASLAPLGASKRRTAAEDALSADGGVIKAKEAGSVRVEYAVQDASKTTSFNTAVAKWQNDFRKAAHKYRVIS